MGEESGTGSCTTVVVDASAVGFLWSADSECPGGYVCIDQASGRLPWEVPEEVGILV
jgi:hypothetical protein